jgi:xylan 1,4-beta-xylosidase
VPAISLRRPLPAACRACGAALALVSLAAVAATQPPAPKRDRISLEVHADQVLGSVNPAAASNLAYEDAFAATVAPANDAGYRWLRAAPCVRYARCSQWLADGIRRPGVRAFSGCRVYREAADGAPEYRWEAFDRVVDVMITAGLRPVIVCGGMPDALAAPGCARGAGGGMTGRPKDYRRYQALIEAMALHLEKTYGREEVRGWFFEVWDQPDRAEYWEGGGAPPGQASYPPERLESFLRLYDHFAAGLAAADPRLRFGGPGIADDERFLRGFLAHCARGTNAASGGKGARLDFISLHAADAGGARSRLRDVVNREFGELGKAAVFVTVPSPGQASQSGAADAVGPPGAVSVLAQADATLAAARPDDLNFQETQLVTDHFNGGPGLIARLGRYTVPVPTLRAQMMLAKTGPERLAVQFPGAVRGFAARSARDAVQVALYRPRDVEATDAQPVPVRLRISGLPRSLVRAPLRVYQVDAQNQNPYGDWIAAGKPNPTPEAVASKWVGKEIYAPTRQETGIEISDGVALVDLEIPADGSALVTIGAEPAAKPLEMKTFDKNTRPRRVLEAEQAYYEAAQNHQAGEFDQAERRYLEVVKRYPDLFWGQVALATLVEMYELDMRRPDRADAARERLLAMPIDDFERERLLRQRLVFVVRSGDSARVAAVQKEIAALGARIASLAP